ncbi:MAG: redoxin domain-containing protein [Balneolaceae bacterium]|nr:redoxin domain-containing protein [Balneolaceae bacterium]
MALETGTRAPIFTLQDSEGKERSLTDLAGEKNLVLLFFPLAFSSVCTRELCQTRDNMKLYESLDAEVAAISVDSFFTLREFKKSNNLNFTLLSDFNREVSKIYDTLYDDYFGMKGVAKRSAYVIDREGVIRYSEVLENSEHIPDFNALQQTLQSI